jgi:hypothetical protein
LRHPARAAIGEFITTPSGGRSRGRNMTALPSNLSIDDFKAAIFSLTHPTCRPFQHNQVYFRDTGHVLPPGAERIYDGFERDFRWLAGKG